MGFYVDLEMPKDCPMCPFANYDDMFNTFRGCDITRGKRWAVKNDNDYAKLSTRPDWCPLTEVPEPHGRLGDLDELKTAFPCGEYVKTESVRATIDHMRTIIPASEEGEA